MDLSDLELVAQATSKERNLEVPPASTAESAESPAGPTTQANGQEKLGDPQIARELDDHSKALRDLGDLDLEEVDLSCICPADLIMLQTLIDALAISEPARIAPLSAGNASGHERGESDGDINAGEGGEGDAASDVEIMRILGQMNAADHVADDLEEKLDRLLESLGKVEAEIDGPAAEEQGGRQENVT